MQLSCLPGEILRGLRAVPRMVFRVAAPPVLAAGTRPLTEPVRDASDSASESGGQYGAETTTGVGFRLLSVATVCAIFGTVTVGGVVRLTDSGLGCPDWPLCHGQIVPQFDKATLIEYSHRMMASVAGLLVVASVLVVWRNYRRHSRLFVAANLALLLLIVQVALGGLTVGSELSSGLVVAHLATAEVLVACTVVICVIALTRSPGGDRHAGGIWRGDRLPVLALGAMMAGYALLLTGSHVATSGATSACGKTWPLCQGQLFPETYLPAMHMLHRAVAVMAGGLIAVTLGVAWSRRQAQPVLGWAALVVGGLLLSQVVVGASILWAGFPIWARLMHLEMATLVWVGLTAVTVLAFLRPSFGQRAAGRA